MTLISRQRRWQLKKQAMGLCVICGKPRHSESKIHCPKHVMALRLRKREAFNCKPYRPGRGKPPFKLPFEEEDFALGSL